jgi:hypothetical protein
MTFFTIRQARRVLLGLGLFIAATAAQAQATRTWVSGVGDDANPCSRTAPCKTYAGAISKTAAGGVIHVLDPGGFGGVTITKSITIDGHGIQGSTLSAGAGVNGVIINAGATDIVTLRNLTFYGAGSATNGIRILNAGAVHIENVHISDYRAASARGIDVAPSTAGIRRVYVRNSTIEANGSANTGVGIRFAPTGGAFVFFTITDSGINGNSGIGVQVGGNAFGVIERSSISGNSKSGLNALGSSEAFARYCMFVDNGAADPANDAAILSSGAGAFVKIANNVITDNNVGLRFVSGGVISSFGDNQVSGNSTNGTVSGTINEL